VKVGEGAGVIVVKDGVMLFQGPLSTCYLITLDFDEPQKDCERTKFVEGGEGAGVFGRGRTR
jgi:hypothetical protein